MNPSQANRPNRNQRLGELQDALQRQVQRRRRRSHGGVAAALVAVFAACSAWQFSADQKRPADTDNQVAAQVAALQPAKSNGQNESPTEPPSAIRSPIVPTAEAFDPGCVVRTAEVKPEVAFQTVTDAEVQGLLQELGRPYVLAKIGDSTVALTRSVNRSGR